ncbi:hypothetical protein BDZ89DRAFT_1081234 [Hymenopellis radicata]|nr:hypothetical protein BDZ89DRAFT_1081234 [Hymenopellis radicata]
MLKVQARPPSHNPKSIKVDVHRAASKGDVRKAASSAPANVAPASSSPLESGEDITHEILEVVSMRKAEPTPNVHKAASSKVAAVRRGSPGGRGMRTSRTPRTDRNLNQPAREADVASSAGGKSTWRNFLGIWNRTSAALPADGTGLPSRPIPELEARSARRGSDRNAGPPRQRIQTVLDLARHRTAVGTRQSRGTRNERNKK